MRHLFTSESASEGLLCKLFRFLLIISKFAQTSIFLHFQGLVALQNLRFYNLQP